MQYCDFTKLLCNVDRTTTCNFCTVFSQNRSRTTNYPNRVSELFKIRIFQYFQNPLKTCCTVWNSSHSTGRVTRQAIRHFIPRDQEQALRGQRKKERPRHAQTAFAEPHPRRFPAPEGTLAGAGQQFPSAENRALLAQRRGEVWQATHAIL
jgi:hypothetical protein